MLGLVIEAIERRPYHAVVDARIASRLKLTSLRALAPDEEPEDVAALRPSNPTEPRMVPNWAYAAGGVGPVGHHARFSWITGTQGRHVFGFFIRSQRAQACQLQS